MSLGREDIVYMAQSLEQHTEQALAIGKFTDDYPDMDRDDGYAVQDEVRRRKLDRGRRVVGYKVSLTSRAKMKQMGTKQPCFGFLTDDQALAEGAQCEVEQLIHPMIEPELAFVTRCALTGPGCHIGTVLAAIDFVIPAIEVIDSRYRDFEFDLPSVIADNASAARFAIGGMAVPVGEIDLRTVGVVLEKNGQALAFGAGAAVLGHPAAAIAMLANHLAERGQHIPAGSLILSGGITEPISVQAGDAVTLRVQGLGSLSMRFA